MFVYCDSLTFFSGFKILQLYRRELLSRKISLDILYLDKKGGRVFFLIWKLFFWLFSASVKEAIFFTGNLRTTQGEAVFLAARRVAIELAHQKTEVFFSESDFIKRINEHWKRNTIYKYILKTLEEELFHLVIKVLVVEALARKDGVKDVSLVMNSGAGFDEDLFSKVSFEVRIFCCTAGNFASYKWRRGSAFIYVLFEKIREVKSYFEKDRTNQLRKNESLESVGNSEQQEPTLLLLQEDDLSMDRSYRTQPHWLFAEDQKTNFRTVVFNTARAKRLPGDEEGLKKNNVQSISLADFYCLTRGSRYAKDTKKLLNTDIRQCVYYSFFGLSIERRVMMPLVRLFCFSKKLAQFCDKYNVQAFMTCENYMVHADAMNLIAPSIGVTTLSYQYSNIRMRVACMLTTADTMLAFSSLYHEMWKSERIQPGNFINVGYIYDTSFELVRPRAKIHRQSMINKGARFIICYLDENTQPGKYGVISKEDQWSEIEALLELLLADSEIGVIVKTQFQRNTPNHLNKERDIRKLALETGRYIELSHGAHRNVVFPAEAALASDIVIGHAIGATAPLEAAVLGKKALLLNPYGMRGYSDFLFEKAKVFYDSLPSALRAIKFYREGKTGYTSLGDWDSIIDQFDPYRDGQAGKRMRKIIDEVFC